MGMVYTTTGLAITASGGGTVVSSAGLTSGGTTNQSGSLIVRGPSDNEIFSVNSGTIKVIMPTTGTALVFDTPNEIIAINAFNVGGTSVGPNVDGGITFFSGTGNTAFGAFSVDEFFMDRDIRLGSATSPVALQLAGSTTSNPVGTPPANNCRIYVDAGGAGGRTRVMAQFDSGAPVLIATEP